jgi:hypothetical protein
MKLPALINMTYRSVNPSHGNAVLCMRCSGLGVIFRFRSYVCIILTIMLVWAASRVEFQYVFVSLVDRVICSWCWLCIYAYQDRTMLTPCNMREIKRKIRGNGTRRWIKYSARDLV